MIGEIVSTIVEKTVQTAVDATKEVVEKTAELAKETAETVKDARKDMEITKYPSTGKTYDELRQSLREKFGNRDTVNPSEDSMPKESLPSLEYPSNIPDIIYSHGPSSDKEVMDIKNKDDLAGSHEDTEELDSGDKPQEEKVQDGGGSYRGCQEHVKENDLHDKEIHHMPAKSSYRDSGLDENDGPCIVMDKADHRQTASCGNSKEAIEYRKKQEDLIKQGKFEEAMEMDIKDIRSKFGSKYDNQISEMKKYVEKLKNEGRI